jgi:alkylation response protein AidB-like acyl-CoA dehydrogenase
MDLRLTDEQQMLRDTVRGLLEQYSGPETVRALEEDETGYRADLWNEMARMGLLGLSVAEEHGGAGQGAFENAILYEELGRALTQTPHFVSCVLGAGVLARSPLAPSWLPRIASGEAFVSVAWFEPGRGCAQADVQTSAAPLSGTKILVPFAPQAARLLVLARASDGVGVYLADPGAAVVTREQTLASDASYEVTFDGADGERVGSWNDWDDVSIDGQIALAAFCVGGARRAHEMAVEYAKERIQFDRPIGSFQAIAHPLADTATQIEGAATLVHEAAWSRDTGRDAAPLAAMAKMVAADVFKRTTKLGQQVFGGIGFTKDIDMQLYFRRAKQLEITWWDAPSLSERIAVAELDAETPFISVDAGT